MTTETMFFIGMGFHVIATVFTLTFSYAQARNFALFVEHHLKAMRILAEARMHETYGKTPPRNMDS